MDSTITPLGLFWVRRGMLNLNRRLVGIAMGAFMALPSALIAQTGVLTWHNDAARTGQNLLETILTPANVSSATFGKLFTLSVDGLVDAQPLYAPSVTIPSKGVHNVLYVATEHDSVYAFDADNGAPLWQVTLLLSGEQTSDPRNCDQVVPEIGITSTPAIDLTSGPHGTIYAVAMSLDSSNNYHQRLHALDLTTGLEEFGGPMEVQATYPSTGPQSSGGVTTFDPKQYKDRAALLISNGVVYTSWASHCDNSPYSAWIIGYNETSLARVSVLDLTPNGNEGSVWQAGAGPAVDGGGNLFFLIANGTFDTKLTAGGFPSKGDYGNAFMNVSTTSGLAVADYFTMDNTVSESKGDVDLGSGGAMLLPTLNDALGNPRSLAVGAGKDSIGYVVDRTNMGKFHSKSNAVYQQIALGGSVFSSPAWFNNTLYYGAVGQQLQAFSWADGAFGLSPSSQSSIGYEYPGATPSISANGSADGIVWAAENSSPAVLHAYDATNLANELYNSNMAPSSRDQFGDGNKYITPTVANGKVYVGTTNGVGVFGPLGCTYTISSNSESFSASAGGDSINVTAPSGCTWTVINTSNFIVVTGGAPGNGNGSVSFTIPADPGISRAGTLVIAGHTFTLTQTGEITTSGLAFYPLTPCRIADTRVGSGFSGNFGEPSLSADTTRTFPILASACNVPSAALAYSLNIGALPHQDLGFLTVWPAGVALPVVGTLGSPTGQNVSNAALVPAGTSGAINLYANASTDVIIDINGYFAPADLSQPLAFYTITPCRVADTLASADFSGLFGVPFLSADVTRTLPMPSSPCGLPDTALAYSLTIDALPHTDLGFLTTWPAGSPLPVVGTLGSPSGQPVSNAALVPAGTAGAINLYANAATDVIVDSNGYFASPGSASALFFYPLTPCRVADTRTVGSGLTGPFGPPTITGGSTRSFPIPESTCNVPATAQAYSLNIGMVAPGPVASLTTWATGQPKPGTMTLSAPQGGIFSDAAIVQGGTAGAIDIFVAATTDVIIDINGYFAP
jgi:hypothetical protein